MNNQVKQIRTELTREFYRFTDNFNQPYKIEMGCRNYGKIFFLTNHYKKYIKMVKVYKKTVKCKAVKKACKMAIKQAKRLLKELQ